MTRICRAKFVIRSTNKYCKYFFSVATYDAICRTYAIHAPELTGIYGWHRIVIHSVSMHNIRERQNIARVPNAPIQYIIFNII